LIRSRPQGALLLEEPSISITVDVEDWYHIPSVTGSPFSTYKDMDDFFEKWPEKYDYLTEPTGRVLDLLEEFGIEATFFVVGDVVEHYPGLVESIVAQGHEIACHGLHHACNIDPRTKAPAIGLDEFRSRTLRSRDILERTCGKSIVGYRAPNALVSGWMLDALEDMGFKYDSSVNRNSLFNKTDSALEGVSSHPYYPRKNGLDSGGSRSFVEFPWPYLDIGIRLPTSGGPMLRFLGPQLILRGLKQSMRRGHTIFYFHPIDISNSSFPRVGKGRPFYWTIHGEKVEKSLRLILKELKSVKKMTLKDALVSFDES